MTSARAKRWRIFRATGLAAALWGGTLSAGEKVVPIRLTHAVLVHGIWQSNSTCFGALRRNLESRGVTCLVPSLKPTDGRDGLRPLAVQLKQAIDRGFGPGQRFVLVGFSMGGLVGRTYLQDLGGAARCDGLFTIATPHHGTRMAALWLGKGAAEMRPGSEFLRHLAAGERRLGKMPLVSYRMPIGVVIVPSENALWAPAENVEIRCPLHTLMTCSPRLMADMLARLDCPAKGDAWPAAVRGR